MSENKGTPKSLTDAIKDGLDHAFIGYTDAEIEMIRVHIKDYLAQKFSRAAYESDQKGEQVVLDLFKESIKKEAA